MEVYERVETHRHVKGESRERLRKGGIRSVCGRVDRYWGARSYSGETLRKGTIMRVCERVDT